MHMTVANRAAFSSSTALHQGKGQVVSWIAGRGFGFIEEPSVNFSHRILRSFADRECALGLRTCRGLERCHEASHRRRL
jgi:hypothetical protein